MYRIERRVHAPGIWNPLDLSIILLLGGNLSTVSSLGTKRIRGQKGRSCQAGNSMLLITLWKKIYRMDDGFDRIWYLEFFNKSWICASRKKMLKILFAWTIRGEIVKNFPLRFLWNSLFYQEKESTLQRRRFQVLSLSSYFILVSIFLFVPKLFHISSISPLEIIFDKRRITTAS